MKKKLIAIVTFAALAGAGCAMTPQSPAQAVYAAHGVYVSALAAATRYKALPPCEKAPQPCSDGVVVKRLQAADNTAYEALSSAQRLARQPHTGNAEAAARYATEAATLFLKLSTEAR